MLYYLVRGFREQRTLPIGAATVAGVLSFLIKAPYAFYLLLPFGMVMLATPDWRRRVLRVVPAILVPATAFAVWRAYVEDVNASAPNWYFIPGYIKFVNMNDWYFGPLSQRLDPDNWRVLWERFRFEVAGGTLGVSLAAIGLLVRSVNPVAPGFGLAWLAGSLLYTTIFFNLNVVHNYYQIPLLAVTAFFIAQGLEALLLREKPHTRAGLVAAKRLMAGSLIAALVILCIRNAEGRYYQVTAFVKPLLIASARRPMNTRSSLRPCRAPIQETRDCSFAPSGTGGQYAWGT